MAANFEGTAVKLSQGPLGIVALFIVLVHAFASVVLGVGRGLSEANRTVLVWFLVLFPVLVFFVFAWLVSCHHAKLYPPQAFREESYFVNLAFGQTTFDQHAPTRSASKPGESVPPLKSAATGSLFWIGHDLMWSADVLLRKAPSEQVLIGLDQARHHLVQIGLTETAIDREILGLRALVQRSTRLAPAARDEYAARLGAIIDAIGAAVEATQPDFKVPPHWSRVRGQPGV
jgi:hypothetical protein